MDNKLVVVGVRDIVKQCDYLYWDGYYDGLQEQLDEADLIIGFNIKFDIHWLRRAGITIDLLRHRVWDCQLAEFILEAQSTPYPSLNNTCAKYNVPLKLDVVKLEYWDKGINTDEIPRDILGAVS